MADLSSLLNVAQGQGALANPVFNVTPVANPNASPMFTANPNPPATYTSPISPNTPADPGIDPTQAKFITDLYKQYANRAPESAGFDYWANKMKQGWTPQQVENGFIAATSTDGVKAGNPIAWKMDAANQTKAINSMPYVLDPSKLSTDTAANKALMYPSILQAGAAPYTAVGGKNIGPSLATQAPGTDFSGAGTMDALVKMVSDKTGMSASDAQNWITSLLPASASSTDPNASLGAGRNIPADTSAYNTASQNW